MNDKNRIRVLKGLIVVAGIGLVVDQVCIRKQHKSILALCKQIDERDSHIKDCYRYSSAILAQFQPSSSEMREINERLDFIKWKSELLNL